MDYRYENQSVRLKKPPCFSLEQIFNCGQSFRFFKEGEGYIGIAFNRVILVYETEDEVVIANTTEDDFLEVWKAFFDLERDYGAFEAHFSGDDVMAAAMAHGSGIRILQQDMWETLITFILSQQNNIARISGMVAALCKGFGDRISFSGKEYYTFPSAQKMHANLPGIFAATKCGFREKYIRSAVEMVMSGEIVLSEIKKMETTRARRELQRINGVGPKVADCVLLFGAGKFDAFPVDVWMNRAIGTLYNKETFNPQQFGPYCGIAQQYLFYYARTKKIGK